MRAIRCLSACSTLLLLWSPVASSQQVPDELTPEMRAMIEKDLADVDREIPVEREVSVACSWIGHLQVHPLFGHIVAMGEQGTIIGWTHGGEPSPWPELVEETVLAAIFDEDPAAERNRIFLATADGLVRRFERGSLESSATYPDDPMWAERTIRAMALSPGADLLAVVGESSRVRVYTVEDGAEQKPFVNEAPLGAVAFLPDGRIVCGDADGKVHAFDPADPTKVTALPAHGAAVVGCAAARGVLYTASIDGAVHAVSLETGELSKQAKPLGDRLDFFCYSPNPFLLPRLLVASARGKVAYLDGATLEVLTEAPSTRSGICAANLDLAARFITVAYDGGHLVQWHAEKLIHGDRPATAYGAPLPFEPSDYAEPGARLGMKLEPVEGGGFRVLGYLLGATRYPGDVPAPGDHLVQIRVGEEWVELHDLKRDLPPILALVEDHQVRFHTLEGEPEQARVPLYDDGEDLFEEVRAVVTGDPGRALGVEFSWRGHVHRVDPEGAAAAAGIGIGDVITLGQMGNAEAWEGALEDVAEGRPVAMTVESADGSRRELEVKPKRRSDASRLARLSSFFWRAGYTEKADELRRLALEKDPGDYRVYLELQEGFGDRDEAVEVLKEGILSARHRLPLVEALVRLHRRRYESADALEVVLAWVGSDSPDFKLAILRARLQCMSDDQALLESLLPPVLTAADAYDGEAQTPAMVILERLGRPDEAKKYRWKIDLLERDGTPSHYPERPAL